MILSHKNSLHLTKFIAKATNQNFLSYRQGLYQNKEINFTLLLDRRPKFVDIWCSIDQDPITLLWLSSMYQACLDYKITIRKLIIPYLAYSRQDHIVKKGEVAIGKSIANSISLFTCQQKIFIDLHSDYIRNILKKFKELDLLPYLIKQVSEPIDMVIAPDKGAETKIKLLHSKLPIITLPKKRQKGMISREKRKYPIRDKHILLIDDMIDTGNTILSAVDVLCLSNPASISVLAVHPVFSDDAKLLLANKTIKSVYVANTIRVESKKQLQVINCDSYLLEKIYG